MLHGAYNIQNWQEIEELKDLCTFVEREALVKTKLKNSRRKSLLDSGLLEHVRCPSKNL